MRAACAVGGGQHAASDLPAEGVLDGVRPPVWRRVLVPGGYTLDRLHRVIQHAMGWRDCHLHSFEIDGVQYGEPDPDGSRRSATSSTPGSTRWPARAAGCGTRYDFGDWWEHELVVEDVLAADPDERYPVLPGRGAGRPAGGRRRAVRLPRLPRRLPTRTTPITTMRAWLGRAFDPEPFDPGCASTLLRRMT